MHAIGRRLVLLVVIDGAKGDTAEQHRGQGLRQEANAIGIQRNIDAARVPEADTGGHVAVVGGMNEDLHGNVLAIGIQLMRDDLAHGEAAKKDR